MQVGKSQFRVANQAGNQRQITAIFALEQGPQGQCTHLGIRMFQQGRQRRAVAIQTAQLPQQPGLFRHQRMRLPDERAR